VTSYTVFPHAPITEALLDIRAELPERVTLQDLETFHVNLKDRFPDKQQRMSYRADFKLSPEGSSVDAPPSKPDGFLFHSPIEKKIVQARLDGFTFNKLKPYESWEVFRLEARQLWNEYFKIAHPVKVTRIALRYINRIEIPLPFKTFKEYVLTTPDIAPALPQGLAQFFMQLVIPNQDTEATAVINQTMETPTDQRLPLIFDIDVFREVVYVDNKEEMWAEIEKLRKFKNDIFFNSITEKTMELFK